MKHWTNRILRGRALRAGLAAMTLLVVSVGGDLAAHHDHVDLPVTGANHAETPSGSAPTDHDPGSPAHHSCGVHLCFHQLYRTQSEIRPRTRSGTRAILPAPGFTTGFLLVPSLDRPPRSLS